MAALKTNANNWEGNEMKYRVAAALAAVFVFQIFLASVVAGAEAVRMDKDDLKALLGEPNVVIIDVRAYTSWFLAGEKIKGAVRENYRNFDAWADKYPKDKTIVLYCT
jgi:predicted sulfurtransferase